MKFPICPVCGKEMKPESYDDEYCHTNAHWVCECDPYSDEWADVCDEAGTGSPRRWAEEAKRQRPSAGFILPIWAEELNGRFRQPIKWSKLEDHGDHPPLVLGSTVKINRYGTTEEGAK